MHLQRPRVNLDNPWLLAAGGLLIGVALAIWVFLTFKSLPVPPASTVEPPQPAIVASAPPVLNTAPLATPVEAAPAAPPDPVDSPFARIDEPPPEPPKRTGMTTHEVTPDQVLWEIAEQYRVRTETIVWANDLDNPDLLLVGQMLIIPPQDGVLYTVRPDDRLADVAMRYGVDLGAIMEANGLGDSDTIVAGVDVFLPGGRPLAPSRGSIVAPGDPDADQAAAIVGPPVALPAHLPELLAAGWLRPERDTTLYNGAEPGARGLHDLPASARLERMGGVNGGRIQVRDPGDGRSRQAMTGWVSAMDLLPGRAPVPRELPLAYPADTAMDIAHVFAPYRSQLDGSPYAEANCGPTAVGMALDAFGINVPLRQLRAETLNAQRMWGNNVGTLITALAAVVQQHGLTTHGLYADGGGISRWTVDDVRAHIARGQPVIAQVRYRSLPGRGNVYYFGDHYILITGVVPGGFLYNDPIDVDGLGWDRVMNPEQLRKAMDASDRRFAFSAFSVSR